MELCSPFTFVLDVIYVCNGLGKSESRLFLRQLFKRIPMINPGLILTPESMMKLPGVLTEDLNWLSKQKERIEKLKHILSEPENKGKLERVEDIYAIKK